VGLFGKERDLNRPPEEVLLEVDGSFFQTRKEELEIRLDHFLGAHLTWRSRSSIQRLIKDRFVYLDPSAPEAPSGRGAWQLETRPGRRLLHGTKVRVVIPPDLRLPVPEGPAGPVEVLLEDDDLLVVDKPPLVPVHPSGRHVNDTLIQRIHAREAERMAERGEAPRLAHRLDRETSGLVLVGRHPRAHTDLRRQFEAGTNDKHYLALCRVEASASEGERDEGSVRLPIRSAAASRVRVKMAVGEDGLPARTDWRILERVGPYALVACELFTGRQHQIRVHLAAVGLPIVGDKLYGPDEELFLRASDGVLTEEDEALLELPRQALHHHRIAFDHPSTGARTTVESPLAPDLVAFLAAQRERYA
jgi:23S rRNA pseudouridine1911/1915/1917 synthase